MTSKIIRARTPLKIFTLSTLLLIVSVNVKKRNVFKNSRDDRPSVYELKFHEEEKSFSAHPIRIITRIN